MKATLYVSKDCHYCKMAKEQIKQMKKDGKCCYDFNIVDVDKNPKMAKKKNLTFVPSVEINGKIVEFNKALERCNL